MECVEGKNRVNLEQSTVAEALAVLVAVVLAVSRQRLVVLLLLVPLVVLLAVLLLLSELLLVLLLVLLQRLLLVLLLVLLQRPLQDRPGFDRNVMDCHGKYLRTAIEEPLSLSAVGTVARPVVAVPVKLAGHMVEVVAFLEVLVEVVVPSVEVVPRQRLVVAVVVMVCVPAVAVSAAVRGWCRMNGARFAGSMVLPV